MDSFFEDGSLKFGKYAEQLKHRPSAWSRCVKIILVQNKSTPLLFNSKKLTLCWHGRLNDWMEGDKIYKVTEEVVGLGSYGRTLTVLTCKTLSMRIETIDDDDDEALVESWTPRFRR